MQALGDFGIVLAGIRISAIKILVSCSFDMMFTKRYYTILLRIIILFITRFKISSAAIYSYLMLNMHYIYGLVFRLNGFMSQFT